jgi:hypothetical protein
VPLSGQPIDCKVTVPLQFKIAPPPP